MTPSKSRAATRNSDSDVASVEPKRFSKPPQLRLLPAEPLGPDAKISILGANRLRWDVLRRMMHGAMASASILFAATASEADGALAGSAADLLITDIVAADGDVLNRLPRWMGTAGQVKRAFVVTGYNQPGVLQALTQLPIEGVFDETAGTEAQLAGAAAEVAAGRGYWSPNVLAVLGRLLGESDSPFRTLTTTERMVFGVLGDGCDDQLAAGRLLMSVTTVNSVRRSLHRKLGVNHKAELLAEAARWGFAFCTPNGMVRPGLDSLLRARPATASAGARAWMAAQYRPERRSA